MLTFLFKKIIKNKWMVACLLLGNILLAGVISSIPLYSQATMQKLLLKQTAAFQSDKGVYPGLMEVAAPLRTQNITDYHSLLNYYREMVFNDMPGRFALPVLAQKETFSTGNLNFTAQTQLTENQAYINSQVYCATGMLDRVKITLGSMCADTADSNGIIEAVVSQQFYDTGNIILGEIYSYDRNNYLLIDKADTDNPPQIEIKVTGVYAPDPADKYFWALSTSTYPGFLITVPAFQTYILDNASDSAYTGNITGDWQINLDCAALDVTAVDRYLSTVEYYLKLIKTESYISYSQYFSVFLPDFKVISGKLRVTLWVLQTPLFVLLFFFEFMVSKKILALDRADISVLKSRGAGRGQILLLYLLQGLLTAVVSWGLGLLLGRFICVITGASNGFLNLVDRSALPVRYNPEAFAYAGAALIMSIVTMMAPAVRFSRVSIVDMKREGVDRKKPIWQMLFLDVLALAVSLYGLYNFNTHKASIAASSVQQSSIDPLMYLTSSLFIIGLGLLCLRIFPWIMRLLFKALKSIAPPAVYVSFLRVIRSAGEEQFIMIFLIFIMAAGIFSAKMARTINQNTEDNIRYEVGADIRLKEPWLNNAPTGPSGSGSNVKPQDIIYYEPDFGRYTNLPETESAAKVYITKAKISIGKDAVDNIRLMGIDSDAFGKTAYYRGDLFPTHFYNYLNSLSRDPRGVLVSSNLKGQFKLGDKISYDADYGYSYGIIYGFVNYWPGYQSSSKVEMPDGSVTSQPNYLIVANLNWIQSNLGTRPYEIWIKTGAQNANYITEYAVSKNIGYILFQDAKAMIINDRNNPVRQGTNGVLTIDFIITLMVCVIGFLIYWILSMKDRVLQFGVFRAMGLSEKNIIGILLSEQALISATAILIGTGVGVLAARLFVPMIQLAYAASDQFIPFLIVTSTGDYMRLFGVIGSAMLICIIILGVIASRIKIAQALKLGED